MAHLEPAGGLHYVEYGTTRPGAPPVVLLHAILSSHRLWPAQGEALAATHRVICPDLWGHGKSGMPAGKVSLEALAGEVVALLDHLGIDRMVLGGLSLGGLVALRVAASIPDRIDRLLLASTRIDFGPDESARFYRTLEALERLGPRALLHGVARSLFAPATRRERPDLVEAWMADAAAVSREALHALTTAVCERSDDAALLSRIRCPTRVMRGEADPLVSSTDARALAAALPDARLTELPGAGHMLPLEAPGPVTKALLELITSAR